MKFKPLQELCNSSFWEIGQVDLKKKMINSLISAAVWKDRAEMIAFWGNSFCDKKNLTKEQLFNYKNTQTTMLKSLLPKVKVGFKYRNWGKLLFYMLKNIFSELSSTLAPNSVSKRSDEIATKKVYLAADPMNLLKQVEIKYIKSAQAQSKWLSNRYIFAHV